MCLLCCRKMVSSCMSLIDCVQHIELTMSRKSNFPSKMERQTYSFHLYSICLTNDVNDPL